MTEQEADNILSKYHELESGVYGIAKYLGLDPGNYQHWFLLFDGIHHAIDEMRKGSEPVAIVNNCHPEPEIEFDTDVIKSLPNGTKLYASPPPPASSEQPEPVAWITCSNGYVVETLVCDDFPQDIEVSLYTSPPPADREDAETIARLFHETYEALAPDFGYTTRPETSVRWDDLPGNNKQLMIATVKTVLASLTGQPPADREDADIRWIYDRFTEIVANRLHYFDRLGKVDLEVCNAADIIDMNTGGLVRYRSDDMFRVKVTSVVSPLMQVIESVLTDQPPRSE